MIRGVKKRVREKGYDVNISHEDIVIPTHCPIFPWIELKLGGGDAAPTLDRIDNDLGYVKGNIQVISYRANRMKSDASLNELIYLGNWAKENKV